MSEPIGLVGLGAMGAPIVRHLRAAQHAVKVYDLDPERSQAAAALGAIAAATLGELAAGCPVILIMVPDDATVRAVLTDRGAILDSAQPGSTAIVSSSVHPQTLTALAPAAAQRDVYLLDAALTGGVRAAEAGTINLLVGGAAADLDRIRAALQPWTGSIHHMGPLGAGQVAKSANNLIHWAQICAFREAFALAAAGGIPGDVLRRALYDSPVDGRALHELEQMRFTWWHKDLEGFRELAGDLGAPNDVAELCQRLMPDITPAGIQALIGPPRV